MNETTRLGCACGKVGIEVDGAPIVVAECCCESCRAAAARMQGLPGVPSVVSEIGGTHYVLYRKDRVRFARGRELLEAFRLTSESPTRRALATCCNTPVFLEFQSGHWLSLYACLWPADARPPIEMRTMTVDLPSGTALPTDVPNAKRQSFSFFARLLGAWLAMGLRSPAVTVPEGAIKPGSGR